MKDYNHIDEYIASFPNDVQQKLEKIRETIRQSAPEAVESISYGMPAYKAYGKPLAYFAAFNKHIGFYATPSGHNQFSEELSIYKQGKGSVQFPLNQPIPFDLIRRMIKFRVEENRKKKLISKKSKTDSI